MSIVSEKVGILSQAFVKDFITFVSHHKLIEYNDSILIGVSGGADSVCLLYLLFRLKSYYKLDLYVAHINYHLRGDDSISDENHVKKICIELGVPLFKADHPILNSTGIEETARKIRLDFFRDTALKNDIRKIALGHNKNDLAETVIYNIIRGCGITGAGGIKPLNDLLIHPLLSQTRKEIIEFLKFNKIKYRVDKTNKQNLFTRNKIRNRFLPWCSKNINEKPVDHLFSFAKINWEAEEILSHHFKKKFSTTILEIQFNKLVRLDLNKLRDANRLALYYILRFSLENFNCEKFLLGENHVDCVNQIIKDSGGSKEIDLFSGLLVRMEYNILTILRKRKEKQEEFCFTIDHFDRVLYTFEKFELKFEEINSRVECYQYKSGLNEVYLDYEEIVFPLTLSNKRIGDKFKPLGMKNFKNLKDFFIDEKVSKYERGKVIILRDACKILWVIPFRIDNRVRISENTKKTLKITYKKYEESK